MSNPGVILLVEEMIKGQSYRIEDNLGENIHIHYGNIRLDLTISELRELSKKMKTVVQELIPIEGIDIGKMEAGFLSTIAPYLNDLERIERVEVEPEKLYTLSEQTGYKKMAIQELVKTEKSSNLDETEISVFNNDNIVISGIDTAIKKIKQKPNEKVLVTRYYFREGKHSINIKKIESQLLLIEKCEEIIREKFKKLSKNAKIAFRGGGIHMEKYLKLMPKELEVACIIEKNAVQEYDLKHRKIIPVSQMNQIEFDTIVICSFGYKEEMKAELEGKFDGEVIDFYDIINKELGIEFSYPYYMIKFFSKNIVL